MHALLAGLVAIASSAVAGWIWSCVKRDVSIVDMLWGQFFLLAAVTYAASTPAPGPRTLLIVTLITLWAVRLSAYIGWRNHGEPEDRRYQAIRHRNEPHFALKSLYLVFGMQAVLAWIISAPLLAAIASSGSASCT